LPTEAVDAAMRRLDEHGRAIVALHCFLGMPLTDVAATLLIPIGTVKSRLHRALGEMRAGLETEVPSPSPVIGGQVA
jgi:DNA-directed RNA polymerase specialized sigma24 family protein